MSEDSMRTPGKLILKYTELGKRVIAGVLIVMMFILVGVATLGLIGALIRALGGNLEAAGALLVGGKLVTEVFGAFLSVLIAMELIETVEVYFKEQSIHAEVVVLVAIIAVARKVVLLDFDHYTWQQVAALAFMTIALAAGYYLLKRAEVMIWSARPQES